MNKRVLYSIAICLLAAVSAYLLAPQEKQRLYFFAKSGCPTCLEAEKALRNNPENIPKGTQLCKVDFASAQELKQKHNVTSPHTFILVDNEGNEVKRWHGDELKEQGWVLP